MSATKIVLICLSLYGTYKLVKLLWSKDAINNSRKLTPLPYKKWTKREIATYDGKEAGTPVLIALDRKVYDVSAGRNFYGPGGPYNMFAGRDSSRLLATQSFDSGLTEEELDSPIDELADLSDEERESLDAYIGLFSVKYRYVGELVES
ncbi:Dihydrodipicolinate synthase [Coemansia spiralis]|uniref:Dihydrodipicolinate synthase n=2 Tax=Coemansia TaxID=4863 RepID=A0A9W8G857_9FUNG|nr:cytochrome b5 [Coemansia spiralis]KAJ1992369.1 Dihydrodipicolinate synthase [Coemansia umbellata]KAJ2622250.1 Dihydrodipicolinate synthase [Coemansia sp. RSA 1358]KAJ2677798.1 Dihydrodipicolinate synthase [Coemansia spiralis]